MLSHRYAPHLVVLCALALAAVVAHAWLGLHREDCANPERLLGAPLETKREEWLRRGAAALDARYGRLALDGGPGTLAWTLIRSARPRKVYYQPEHGLVPGVAPLRRGIEWIEAADARLPVHRAWYPVDPVSDTTRLAAYLLIYQGRAVADPIRAQLRAAPVELFIGAAPMTLVFVSGSVLQSEVPSAEARAREWLLDQWRLYRYACES
jgi:hypothetical protein